MTPYIGLIVLLPYSKAPRGWALCEGQLLQISDYDALYALFGTRFGGDGKTTFALPDLSGKSPSAGMEYYIAVTGLYPPLQ